MDLDQHEMGGRCTDDLGLVVVLNVPLDPLRLGAWSTRTTHPFYMARWQELLDDLGIGAKLLNPYRFKTKGEMLSECASSSFIAANYDVTVSCSAIAKGRWKKRPPGHCGYCAPCLIRRASIEAAFGKDATAYSIADLHAQALDAQKAESADIRAFQMMHRRLGNNPDLAHVLTCHVRRRSFTSSRRRPGLNTFFARPPAASSCPGSDRLQAASGGSSPPRAASTPHLRWHQSAILLPPPVVGLLRNPRLAANLLDPRPFLHMAQDERNLLVAELRPLHGKLPGWSSKTKPRIFSLSLVQIPGNRSAKLVGWRSGAGRPALDDDRLRSRRSPPS